MSRMYSNLATMGFDDPTQSSYASGGGSQYAGYAQINTPGPYNFASFGLPPARSPKRIAMDQTALMLTPNLSYTSNPQPTNQGAMQANSQRFGVTPQQQSGFFKTPINTNPAAGASQRLMTENGVMAGGTAKSPVAWSGNVNSPGGMNFAGVPTSGGNVAGGGGGGSVGQQLQSAMDKANAANERRYTQLLNMASGLSNAGLERENQQRNYDLGRVDQDAISAGLGNTTVLPDLEMGVEDQSAIRQQEIGDQGLKTAMGIVERRTDQQPDYGLIAQLASRPGAVGGASQFNGGSYVAGGPPTGVPGGSAGYGTPAPGMYAQLAEMMAGQNPQQVGDGFTSSNNNGYGHLLPDGYMHLQPDGTMGYAPTGF